MTPEPQPNNNHPATPNSDALASSGQTSPSHKAAATNIIRQQIDQIYDIDPPHKEVSEDKIQDKPASVYKRTHSNKTAYAHVAKQWQHYHNSWQNYYQQYYQQYYQHQLRQRQSSNKATVEPTKQQPSTTKPAEIIGSGDSPEENETSINALREQVLGTVRQRAENAKKSRHFIPIITAIAVVLIFVFLQYNQLLFAQVHAYVSPGSIKAQNIVVDPNASTKVGPEPKLIIPKINVEVPVVYGLQSLEDAPVQEALKGGVVNYPIPGASSMPGQVGNTVMLGHSSNDIFNSGKYKFIFVQLDKLQKGDTIYVNYKGKRYTYSVMNKKVVKPEQVSSLAIKTDKPLLTLVTCTPAGTALNRLLVTAKQISPNPTKASKPTNSQNKPSSLAGNAPTLLEQIFGN